jgi:hypothetical protein
MTTKRPINYLLALPLEHFSPCSFKFSSSNAMPSWKITWASSYLCMVSLHCLSTVWSVQETHSFYELLMLPLKSAAAVSLGSCQRRVLTCSSTRLSAGPFCALGGKVDGLLAPLWRWSAKEHVRASWVSPGPFYPKKAADIPWHSLWIYSNGFTVVLFSRR